VCGGGWYGWEGVCVWGCVFWGWGVGGLWWLGGGCMGGVVLFLTMNIKYL